MLKNKRVDSLKSAMQTNIFLLWVIRFCIVVSLIVLWGFTYRQYYSYKLPLDTEIIGHYGDFIGGVIGTILSVVLLYFTFRSQIEEFARNSKVFEWQELNTTFFHLLDQYNDIVESIEIIDDNDIQTKYKGKQALHYIYEQMYGEFRKNNINGARKVAVGYFMGVYAAYRDYFPTYFRTIYRMIDILDTAIGQLPNNDKNIPLKYMKILRAQFTDSELLFLYYNSNTQLGKKMRSYIVKYNLLKHMPSLSLLEYNSYSQKYSYVDRCKANDVLINTRKLIRELLYGNKTNLPYTSNNVKYNLNVSCNKERTQIEFHFTRNLRVKIHNKNEFTCFDMISIADIKDLFERWIREEMTLFMFTYRMLEIRSVINSPALFKEHFYISLNSNNPLNDRQ